MRGGGNYQNIYSNAEVTARENAGGFAGLVDGYIMNNNANRRIHVDGFYFRGTVNAALKNAGAFAGTYNHGTQQKNSDGTLYLNEKVPTQINADTVTEDGSVVDPGTVYIQRIILAPDSVTAATGTTAKLVANFERKTEEGSGIAQDEVGTTAARSRISISGMDLTQMENQDWAVSQ